MSEDYELQCCECHGKLDHCGCEAMFERYKSRGEREPTRVMVEQSDGTYIEEWRP